MEGKRAPRLHFLFSISPIISVFPQLLLGLKEASVFTIQD